MHSGLSHKCLATCLPLRSETRPGNSRRGTGVLGNSSGSGSGSRGT